MTLNSSLNHDKKKQSFNYWFKSFIAGGVAGCCAKTVIAPLDRVKILFQTGQPKFQKFSGHFFGVFSAAYNIKNEFGIRGLFQGHSATLLRIFPYAAVKYMSYEQYKSWLMPSAESETAFRRTLAGSLAGVTSLFISYPFDLLRVRLAFDINIDSKNGVSVTKTFLDIFNEPSPFFRSENQNAIFKFFSGMSNFYRGFCPTVYGMIPYAGVSFLTYETLKNSLLNNEKLKFLLNEQHQKVNNKDTKLDDILNKKSHKTQLGVLGTFFAGSVAGICAQSVSYPLEIVRRNMQIGGLQNKNSLDKKPFHLNTFQTIQLIYKNKGVRGFFVGLTIGYIKVVPMFAVSFYTYEWMKVQLNID